MGGFPPFSVIYPLLPVGFEQIVKEAKGIKESVEEINTEFNAEKKCKIKIEWIDGYGCKLIKRTVTKIVLTDKFEFVDARWSSYSEQESYNDELFKICKELLNKKKEAQERMYQEIKVYEDKLKKLLEEDYNKILVTARLTENG